MKRAAALAAVLGCASADISFSRTITKVPSYASGKVTIAGSACTGSDQYGSNDCTLAWGTSYDVTYDVSLTQSLPTATISADLKIDGLISFKPSCKACGENCTLTIPVVKKTVSFYPGDCPIPATTLSNTTSVAVPAAPSTLPKTSVKGSVTVTDGSGAAIGGGTVTASVAKDDEKAQSSPNGERVFKDLCSHFKSSTAVAGIMGNIAVETGYTYDYQTHQSGGGNGYGLFQFDYLRSYYTSWLSKEGKTDSGDSQIDFVYQTIYGNQQGLIGSGRAATVRSGLESGNVKTACDTFANSWEQPGVPHLSTREQYAEQWSHLGQCS